ncbi:unnamed protein product, partial [Vitis vinifera]
MVSGQDLMPLSVVFALCIAKMGKVFLPPLYLKKANLSFQSWFGWFYICFPSQGLHTPDEKIN